MTKNPLLLVLSLLSILLSGCKNETIQEVKNSPINSSLTFSQALENTPYCNDSKWSSDKDRNARDTVTHTCEITVHDENIAAHKEKMLIRDATKFRSERATYLKYDYSRLENLKAQLSQKERYQSLINERCQDGMNVTSRSLNDDCYDYRLQLNSINKMEEEFVKKIGANSISEAIQIHENSLNNDKALTEEDNKFMPTLVDRYNQKISREFPNTIEIRRTVTITLLPDQNLEWSAPRFTISDRQFTSSGLDIATRDIFNERLKPNYNIDEFLLNSLFKIDTYNDFISFINSQCTEDGCPLNFML